jgi:hypothetical protein
MFPKTIQEIRSPHDLAEFIRLLRQNYVDNPQSWENDNLSAYLDAMAAWVDDSEGYFKNHSQPLPDPEMWKLIALVLYAATMYE